MSLWFVSSLAFADIPPPEGYVEQCTIEKQAAGRECRECQGSFSGRPDCEALEKEGFTKVCQTYGASAYTEVLCKGEPTAPAPAPASVPTESGARGCRAGCDQAGGIGAFAWGVGALLFVMGRKARRA